MEVAVKVDFMRVKRVFNWWRQGKKKRQALQEIGTRVEGV